MTAIDFQIIMAWTLIILVGMTLYWHKTAYIEEF